MSEKSGNFFSGQTFIYIIQKSLCQRQYLKHQTALSTDAASWVPGSERPKAGQNKQRDSCQFCQCIVTDVAHGCIFLHFLLAEGTEWHGYVLNILPWESEFLASKLGGGKPLQLLSVSAWAPQANIDRSTRALICYAAQSLSPSHSRGDLFITANCSILFARCSDVSCPHGVLNMMRFVCAGVHHGEAMQHTSSNSDLPYWCLGWNG